ncbi:MarR family winged helix-turn-helix transcriptional regulator [Blastococcus tunisiensis]|uniref:DNA-binding transcriptional regulator, MarR family n=1 Tax=Blastococcus tunisiensis TaxID=1798228 RepID=A0A1I2DT75_9ACTN|nr:MarR family winged helix-turn-helix transcriptional regulator [Blastococcus sp. DSM 46838]SFE83431.1 DNA-binding transcriptional regulator, MarR family [Blastococcus sp. DSM 46838]
MDDADVDRTLLGAVRLAMAVSVRAADAVGDVSAVQLRALAVLRGGPGANLGRLAEGLGITMSTSSRLVDRLVAGGLVERRPSPQTRREISLFLTQVGRTTLERYDRLRLEQVHECLHRVPDVEREGVVAALAVLVGAGDAGPALDPPG